MSYTDFASSFEWQRQFIPEIKRIIGCHLLREGTAEEDRKEATDLRMIILRVEHFRIACRVRRPNGYATRYPFDVTITSRRETGAPCEWNKLILSGMADWFFYAHAPALSPRYLIDLSIARQYLLSDVQSGKVTEKPNKDEPGRRCFFFSFDVRRLPPTAIIEAQPALQWHRQQTLFNTECLC